MVNSKKCMVFWIFIVLRNGNFIYKGFTTYQLHRIKKKKVNKKVQPEKEKKQTAATSRNEAIVAIREGKLHLGD